MEAEMEIPSGNFANQLTQDVRIASLAEGKPLLLQAPPIALRDQSETAESRASRTISADALNQFVRTHNRTIAASIEIRDAIVEGSLDWRDVTFRSAVVFERCEFTGDVDISGARFERRCELARNLFRGKLTADGAQFQRNLLLDCSSIALQASFRMVQVNGEASFLGAHFHGAATFEQFRCEGALRCRSTMEEERLRLTCFHAGVTFLDASARHYANFAGAQFWGDASFERMRTDGPVFFRSYESKSLVARTTFYGASKFLGMYVEQVLHFQGVRLREKRTSFACAPATMVCSDATGLGTAPSSNPPQTLRTFTSERLRSLTASSSTSS